MIKKVLIANRGEIASRVIRTCKKLGIKTVAVYSEADQHAPYVKIADESYLLGPPRVNESYLKGDKIISIAKAAKVNAIHPGYGFLSEDYEFVRACEAAGLIFIGPSSEIMKQMASKIEARKTMEQAGVPIIPGTKEAVISSDEAIEVAQKIGYPLMLKASAGGGGIGMQIVHSDKELEQAFSSNTKRAEAFFGDGSMFLEKKLTNARHIEVQVLADEHGNVVHLFERECSIQRRNQKVIEEAPSSFISSDVRRSMGESAVKAAKTLGYTSAGTVEFLVDQHGKHYFLEMNTRIQVEHPITEEITGVDIVEEQINIANNLQLAFTQADLRMEGHAIEARIYAEDPKTFFPSPGHITTFDLPEAGYIRHETTVTSNYQVTPFYDPMISKLIVKGANRKEAISRLSDALSKCKIEGIKTNIPMVIDIVNNQEFKNGNTTTAFVDEHYLPMLAKN